MTAKLVLAAVGVLIVGFAVADQLWTTLAVGNGAGPMTARVVGGLWRMALRHHDQRRHGFLARVGVPIVMLTVVLWALLLWLGWSLVFSATDTGLVVSATMAPASVADQVYFAGYTIMTLGNGGYKPTGTFFQLATDTASATGFFVVTLSITYLVPVVSAVVQRRQLASQISGLGFTPGRIVTQAWSGGGFPTLPLQFVSLSSIISTVAQQHQAYPVLRVFHSKQLQTATTPAVAALTEAVLLLEHGVAAGHRPPAGLLLSLSSAISDYQRVLPVALPVPDSPPPAPDLAPLRMVGIPTVSEEEFDAAVRAQDASRRRLAALVHGAGWPWNAIVGT